MTTDLHTLVLIVLCGVVTLLVRVIPFIMISGSVAKLNL